QSRALSSHFFPIMTRLPPRYILFPYTTLFRSAKMVRERKFELNALVCYEVGKTWVEADADIAEAIDFLEFYGREMLRLGEPQKRSEEHTSEPSHRTISYAVFCLKKKIHDRNEV